MQPMVTICKATYTALIGERCRIRGFIVVTALFGSGCCQSVFQQGNRASRVTSNCVCIEGCTSSVSLEPNEGGAVICADSFNIGCSTSSRSGGRLGCHDKLAGARLVGHLQDNCLSRALAAHKARQAAKLEAKNAPPWPTFHPIPTGPVFFPDGSQPIDKGPQGVLSQPSPTANYGQFEPAK